MSSDGRQRRYARQELLPEWGPTGQARLAASHVAIVGLGALGGVSAELLARAGVGRLTLVDRDTVEWTNLQRQTLYDEEDARRGRPKAEAAAARLAQINGAIRLRPLAEDASPGNIERLLLEDGPPTVIVDGTDNFETRYLLNDLAVREGIALAYGGVIATGGVQGTFVPGESCLRCVVPMPPEAGSQPTCDTAGVLAPAVWIVAAAQAADAIKVALGRLDLLSRTLLQFDLWRNERRRIAIPAMADPHCPCCGRRDFSFLAGAGATEVAKLCGREAIQVRLASRPDLAGLAQRLARSGHEVEASGLSLRVTLAEEVGTVEAMTVFGDGRVIVAGTTDPAEARAACSRIIGG